MQRQSPSDESKARNTGKHPELVELGTKLAKPEPKLMNYGEPGYGGAKPD